MNDASGTIEGTQVLLRLLGAMFAGAWIGLNRDLRGKPAGLRTHALVATGAAAITIASIRAVAGRDPGAITHTIQGIITGCGFIGAGVILHPAHRRKIQGLTTAASLWVVACLGSALGIGDWVLAGAATLCTLFVLTAGGPIERFFHKRLARPGADDDLKDDDRG